MPPNCVERSTTANGEWPLPSHKRIKASHSNSCAILFIHYVYTHTHTDTHIRIYYIYIVCVCISFRWWQLTQSASHGWRGRYTFRMCIILNSKISFLRSACLPESKHFVDFAIYLSCGSWSSAKTESMWSSFYQVDL